MQVQAVTCPPFAARVNKGEAGLRLAPPSPACATAAPVKQFYMPIDLYTVTSI
jgi:hypothetical protein